MHNIFIAASPLQLLNCIEASHHFKTKNNILLIAKEGKSKNLDQMIQLLEIYCWDKIIYLDLPVGFLKYIRYPSFIKSFLKETITMPIENIFVGAYRSMHINHLVNFLDVKNIYLVDDGVSTLSYEKYNKSKSIKKSIRDIIYRLMLYKTKNIKYIFFTCFYLENYKTIENAYDYIKKYKSNVTSSNMVMFIGQPLVELSVVTPKYYKEYMKKIIHYFDNQNFIYILHRGNDRNFIDGLSKELGFKYLEFDNLIELEILQSSNIPCTIATFYSTGIYTLNKIFKNVKYVAFRIEKEHIDQKLLSSLDIESYYKEFEKSGILVEDIERYDIFEV